MGTARQLSDLELQEIELLDEDRLNALINRKLEEAQESLHCGGRRYTQEEMDEFFEKMLMGED